MTGHDPVREALYRLERFANGVSNPWFWLRPEDGHVILAALAAERERAATLEKALERIAAHPRLPITLAQAVGQARDLLDDGTRIPDPFAHRRGRRRPCPHGCDEDEDAR